MTPNSPTPSRGRTVVVKFNVDHDDESNMPFLETLAWCWEQSLGNPGESYEVVSDDER